MKRKYQHKRPRRAKLDPETILIDQQGSLVDALTIPTDPAIETMPEKALCIAVIMMAVADATFNDKTILPSNKRHARKWLMSNDTSPRSFLWWFNWLSIDSSYIQKIRNLVILNIETGAEPDRIAVLRLFF